MSRLDKFEEIMDGYDGREYKAGVLALDVAVDLEMLRKALIKDKDRVQLGFLLGSKKGNIITVESVYIPDIQFGKDSRAILPYRGVVKKENAMGLAAYSGTERHLGDTFALLLGTLKKAQQELAMEDVAIAINPHEQYSIYRDGIVKEWQKNE